MPKTTPPTISKPTIAVFDEVSGNGTPAAPYRYDVYIRMTQANTLARVKSADPADHLRCLRAARQQLEKAIGQVDKMIAELS